MIWLIVTGILITTGVVWFFMRHISSPKSRLSDDEQEKLLKEKAKDADRWNTRRLLGHNEENLPPFVPNLPEGFVHYKPKTKNQTGEKNDRAD